MYYTVRQFCVLYHTFREQLPLLYSHVCNLVDFTLDTVQTVLYNSTCLSRLTKLRFLCYVWALAYSGLSVPDRRVTDQTGGWE